MNNEEIHHRNGAPLGRREDLLLAAAKASGMLPGGYCKGQKICTISIKPQCANNLELDYSSGIHKKGTKKSEQEATTAN